MTTSAAPSINEQALRAVLTTLAALAVNLAIYGLARVAGVSLIIPLPGEGTPTQLPIGALVSATVVGVVLGAVVLGFFRRFRPEGIEGAFALTVGLFTLLSLTGPLGLDTSLSNKLVLVTMHLATAVITVLGLVIVRPLTTTTAEPG